MTCCNMNIGPDRAPVKRHPPHLLVVFAGASGSGKTTLAKAVYDKLLIGRQHYPVRESYAKPLKRVLSAIGIERGHPKFREAAQYHGDRARAANVDHYVDLLIDRVRSRESMACVFLVDDGRRINEGPAADLVFRLHTSRPNALTPEQRAHPSETEWSQMGATMDFCTDSEADIEPFAREIVRKITAFAAAAREE